MGNWKINPDIGINNGSVSFRNVTKDTDYTITYTDDNGCEATKDIKAVPRERKCDCSNIKISEPKDTDVLSKGGDVKVSFTADCGTVKASAYPSTGNIAISNDTVTFTIGENTSINDRTYNCKVWLDNDNSCQYGFIITQKGSDKKTEDACGCGAVTIRATSNSPYSGGMVYVPFTADCSMTLVVNVNDGGDYLDSDPKINEKDSTIAFSLKENTGTTKRMVKGYVGYKDENENDIQCKSFTITQSVKPEDFETECNCVSANLSVTSEKSVISYDTTAVTVTCSYDCDDTIEVECGDMSVFEWIRWTVYEGNKRIGIEIPENEGDEPRELWCNVKMKKYGCEKKIRITQNSMTQVKEECEFSDFNLKMENEDNIFYDSDGGSNTTGTTFTLECSGTGFTQVCTIEHCGCPDDEDEPSPVRVTCTPSDGWLEVSAVTKYDSDGDLSIEADTSKLDGCKGGIVKFTVNSNYCHTDVYVRTKNENNSGNDLYGSVSISIDDSHGMSKNDKWKIPVVCVFDEKVCPKEELTECDTAICGDIDINVFGNFEEHGGNSVLAEFNFKHLECSEFVSITPPEGITGVWINASKTQISAKLPDLSECGKYVDLDGMVYYDFELVYKINGEECTEKFTVSQYRNNNECSCQCDSKTFSYTANTDTLPQTPEPQTKIFEYELRECARLTGVDSDSISNIKIDEKTNTVYGDLPDLSECGHDTDTVEHSITVKYWADFTNCKEVIYIEQEANSEGCVGQYCVYVNQYDKYDSIGGLESERNGTSYADIENFTYKGSEITPTDLQVVVSYVPVDSETCEFDYSQIYTVNGTNMSYSHSFVMDNESGGNCIGAHVYISRVTFKYEGNLVVIQCGDFGGVHKYCNNS